MKKNIVWFGSLVLVGMMMFSVVRAATPTVVTDGTVTTAGVCADAGTDKGVNGILNMVTCSIMGVIIPLLFSLAAAAFIWGVISYYLNPDNEEKRKKGKSFIIGGLIALFVMTSMWGIVKIFSTTLGTGNPVIPSLDVNK